MRPFWHPLSTILLIDPPCWATPSLLRMFLPSGGTTTLAYAGDRMWPTVRHGSRFTIDACKPREVEPGDAVLVDVSGVPDLLRVLSSDLANLTVAGDAEPETTRVDSGSVLGRARLPRTIPGPRLRATRRARLDLVESLRGRPDAGADPAESVLAKYEAQASFYARGDQTLDRGLRERVRGAVRPGGRILVVGSGAGNECFALARDGFRVMGVDFSPAMVAHAREQARRQTLEIEFETADIRHLGLKRGSLDGVLFTYDVYSFLPHAPDRIATLRLLRAALREDGALLLSARRTSSVYQAWILTVQWLATRARKEWGSSHTRWIGTDGAIRRSFVQVFRPAALDREICASGFGSGAWLAGHATLRSSPSATAIMPSHRGCGPRHS